MAAQIIDGRGFASRLVDKISAHAAELKTDHNLVPGLAVILVGSDPASQVYVRNKTEKTKASGMRSLEYRLDADTSQAELLKLIDTLNRDDAIDGILVQLPLPPQIDESAVIQTIAPQKDVDGFHVVNAGLLATGQPALVPCTPYGCLMLLEDQLKSLGELHAVVLGRSNIVGKPMAQLLLGANATVTIAHSRTRDLPDICRQADILIAAVGRPQMVTGDWIKKGATVIDVGINRVAAPELGPDKFRLTGDVDFASAEKQAGAITPVPGGVGPMTIACLLRNTLVASCRRRQIALDIS